MEKFSKKLVSKCIYIQILKCTETEFLGQFMGVGGWNLTHNWLQDGIKSCNWPFVQELLEMLLLCPVDGNRLKSNITPKLVKNLSTTSCQHQGVRVLATKLVEQWLRIAHLEKQQLTAPNGLPNGYGNHTNNDDSKLKSETIIAVQNNNLNVINTTTNNVKLESVKTDIKSDNGIEESKNSSEIAKYKISNNGGLTLQLKRTTSPSVDDKDKIKASPSSSTTSSSDKTKDKSKSSSSSDRDKDKERSSSSNSSSRKPSSSSSRSSSSKSSHRDKERSSSSSQHKSSSSSKNSSSSSRDKSKDSDKKSSSSSSRHSSSSSSSRDKERAEKRRREQEKSSQAEKDQETLNLVTASVPSAKLLKIPKRQHSDNMENKSPESGADKNKDSSKILKKSGTVDSSTAALLPPKKPSISIEVRKGDKPKTVKTFNSQFRSHGLAEEAPPPPTRKGLKKPGTTPILPLPTITLPSSSIIPTIRSLSPPPNKKIHLEKTAMDMEIQERVGGVKLIKPKRKYCHQIVTINLQFSLQVLFRW